MVRDLVQAEIDGSWVFEKPRRVRAIQEHDGQMWVFVDGEKAGVLMEQVTIEQKGGEKLKPPVLEFEEGQIDGPPPPGKRREVFALDEGDVVLTFPESLSADSFEDLRSYVDVFLRKAARRAGVDLDKGKTKKDEATN